MEAINETILNQLVSFQYDAWGLQVVKGYVLAQDDINIRVRLTESYDSPEKKYLPGDTRSFLFVFIDNLKTVENGSIQS